MRSHLLCEECHEWYVEGTNHASRCEPPAPAKHGEILCDRCYVSYPEEMLDMGFCPDCSNIISRVMAGR